MFFWVGLAVALLVFVCAFAWAARGFGDRVQPPGTQRLLRRTGSPRRPPE